MYIPDVKFYHPTDRRHGNRFYDTLLKVNVNIISNEERQKYKYWNIMSYHKTRHRFKKK